MRKAAPSRGAEDLNAHGRGGGAHQPAPQSELINRKEPASDSGLYKGVFDRLKFGVGVRADFAVQIDFFVLRGDPFHERGSLRVFNTKQRIAQSQEKEEQGNPLEQQLSPLRVWSLRPPGMIRLDGELEGCQKDT